MVTHITPYGFMIEEQEEEMKSQILPQEATWGDVIRHPGLLKDTVADLPPEKSWMQGLAGFLSMGLFAATLLAVLNLEQAGVSLALLTIVLIAAAGLVFAAMTLTLLMARDMSRDLGGHLSRSA